MRKGLGRRFIESRGRVPDPVSSSKGIVVLPEEVTFVKSYSNVRDRGEHKGY